MDSKNKKKESSGGTAELFFWAQALTFALVILVCINTFFFRLSGVRGTSMLNTLDPGNQLVLQVFGYSKPERGDVIVCTSDAFNGEALVKRVIAVEGDTVDINGNGQVVVNGEALVEPYAREPIADTKRGDQIYPLTVDENCVFVMGDNRNHSTDSRWTDVGQIHEERIIGKALFRIWPLNRIGGIS